MNFGKRLDTRSNNIDEYIDMMNNVKRENGIEPTMREALFDPVTKRRINKFERTRLELAGVDLSEYGNSSCSGNCKNCKGHDKHMSNIERGVFVYNEDDLVDESDELYVCEYCTMIGYDGKYKPEVCDTCTSCEECTEYMNGECDGCGYSPLFNGGSSYGELTNGVENTMCHEDETLFEELEEDEPDYEVRYPDGGFTIMNY